MIQFSDTYQLNPGGLAEMVMSDPQRFELKPTQVLIVKLQKSSMGRQLVQTKNILKEIVQRVSG